MRNCVKVPLIVCCIFGILALMVIFVTLFGLHRYDNTVKPYISYTRLINLAQGIDDYKQQNGQWPTNLAQLIVTRPDLAQATIDAYGNMVILVNYNSVEGFGELISYGKDGKPGGNDEFSRDLIIHFPLETNTQWNSLVADRFKSRSSRGLP